MIANEMALMFQREGLMEDQKYKEDWKKRLWSKSINQYNQTLKEKLIFDKSNIVLRGEKTPKVDFD